MTVAWLSYDTVYIHISSRMYDCSTRTAYKSSPQEEGSRHAVPRCGCAFEHVRTVPQLQPRAMTVMKIGQKPRREDEQ
jgi:hypothetical protein